ncbi:MAG: MmgE/PrpD family protein [Firmicutes bacterium]|nr:MmgE/PrpD family protein [Bacillota bacterium]
MDNPITKKVAEFIVDTNFEHIPRDVIEGSRAFFYDGLGVALCGAKQDCSRMVRDFVAACGGRPEASVLGTGLRAPAQLAALANGVAGHADDYDDTQIASLPDRVTGLLVHPTTPVLAAALAVAEARDRSGRDLLAAYNIGVEVECKLAEAINPEHYRRGFHSTGTLGALGAVAAASKLLDLSLDKVIRALGIAASMSAGLRVNFGTMTKPLHAGRAAENGVVAALLAERGFTSSPDVFDSQWGFFQIMGGGFDAGYLESRLASPWQIQSPGISIKPYPCGSLGHPTMDAVRDLLREHQVKPEQIERIDVEAASNIVAALRYTEPENELEAKFSLQYGVTLIALFGRAGIREYTDETVRDPNVRRFMKERVRVYNTPDIDARGYDRMHTVVRIRLTDGTVLTRDAQIARGYPERPLSPEEQMEKFTEGAQGVLDPSAAEDVWQAVQRLEELPSARSLLSRLVRPPAEPVAG